ncbi:hypothetical protein BBJ28_00000285 [Nothophytophthora sp. Chile5]|nr:hypothetical protein BBJ28_00000285 [Nothophytophthora sp. Chile5]
MGRSQVKYRATHGRGRGRGRGEAAGGRGEESTARGRSRGRGGRSLGSNAFRFEEREEQDSENDQQEREDHGGRTQFFASEQSYRDPIAAAPGAHFQSRTMQQWEESDDAADDQGTVGVLTDLVFEPQDEEDGDVSGENKKDVSAAPATTDKLPPRAASTPAQGDAELDFLLNLTASTPSASSSSVSNPVRVIPVGSAPAPTTPAATEELEDWLDDVLDM